MKPVILFIVVIAAACQAFAGGDYRLKQVNNLQFTLPPGSRLADEGCFCSKDKLTYVPKSRYRYQYLAIKGLNFKSYYAAADAVEAGDYFYARKQQRKSLKRDCGIVFPDDQQANGIAVLGVSPDGNCAAVEVDLDKVFAGDIRSNYLNLTISVLKDLQATEALNGKWPKGISQRIVAEVFQVLPHPEASSLLRFVADTNKRRSFVLLDANIRLKVDAVERIRTPNTVQWHYRLLGTSLISFTRSAQGNLIQSPLHQFQEAGPASLPDNVWSGTSVLQASTADIQLSSALNQSPYVFVQQRSFKKNNNVGSSEGSGAGLEEDLTDKCNSVLYHFSDLSAFYDATEGWVDDTHAHLSSFGTRNLITPLIDVFVNGRREQVPLNLTLRQFRVGYNIPNQFQYSRLHRGKYTRVDLQKDDDILLLPGDRLTYQVK